MASDAGGRGTSMKYAGWIVAAAVVLLALTQGRQTAGPMQATVVAGQVETSNGNDRLPRIYRFWSDGGVDVSFREFISQTGCEVAKDTPCGPVVLIPGSCPGDITRDGTVATADLLGVLETWGPCPEQGEPQ